MLILLHEKINSIVPIQGISDNGDGTYRVDYITEPTEDQLALVSQTISDYPLTVAKQEKLKQIDANWVALEQTGWDSGQGFNLGIAPSDVALLVGVFSLAKEAAAMGLAIPSIIAMNNSVVNFETISEMTVLLLRYGAARSQLSDDFAAKRRSVESATTVEEVELIQ
jgi:hypothetical protein